MNTEQLWNAIKSVIRMRRLNAQIALIEGELVVKDIVGTLYLIQVSANYVQRVYNLPPTTTIDGKIVKVYRMDTDDTNAIWFIEE